MNDPCDRCDGEGKDCVNCQWVRKWLSEKIGVNEVKDGE